MMKFAAFERTVEFLYKNVVPVPRSELGKGSQLVVTFAAGYIAGVFCAVVSHPADSVVSKLNSVAGSTAMGALKQLGFMGRKFHYYSIIIIHLFEYDGVFSMSFPSVHFTTTTDSLCSLYVS